MDEPSETQLSPGSLEEWADIFEKQWDLYLQLKAKLSLVDEQALPNV